MGARPKSVEEIVASGKGDKKSAKPAAKAARKSAATKEPSAAKPASASLRAPSADTDLEADVTAVVAGVCKVTVAEVGAKPLSKLTSNCDVVFRGRIAAQLNAKWSNLNPRFSSDDIACADTVDTLTSAVTTRLG
jgi:hypothetical protein